MLDGLKNFWRWIGLGQEEAPPKRRSEEDLDEYESSPKKRRRIHVEEQFRIISSEGFTNPLLTWKYSAPQETCKQLKISRSSTWHNSSFMNNKENALGLSLPAHNVRRRGKTETPLELDIDVDEDPGVVQSHRISARLAQNESQWVTAFPKPSTSRHRVQKPPVNYDEIVVVEDDDEIQCLDAPPAPQFNAGGMTFSSNTYSLTSVPSLNKTSLKSKIARFPKNVFSVSHRAARDRPHRAIDEVARLQEKAMFQDLISKNRMKNVKKLFFPRQHARSSEHSQTVLSLGGDPPIITLDSNVPVREVIDLVDKPVKPTTLATKLADQGFRADMKVPVRKPSVEEVFNSSFFYSNLIKDVNVKYNQKNRENEERLKVPQLQAESYSKQNENSMKIIEERMRQHLALTEVVCEDKEVEIIPQLPELTPDMLKKVQAALTTNQRTNCEVLVDKFSLSITRHDMACLGGLNWLNDEVINFYMNLLIERGKLKEFPNTYAFNTFFYPKLMSSGHSGLKRWTRKIDLLGHDLIVVPVHLGVHWCLAVVDFRDKHIRYYDSMGNTNNKCLQSLLRYLCEESLDKKKCVFETDSWKLVNLKEIPQQMNGSDCGVFSCMFAEYVSRNVRITFTQDDMPYFRKKMAYEILTSSLMEFH